MRFLKQYGGVLLILLAVAVLAVAFYMEMMSNEVLGRSLGAIILGIFLMIFGGKSADKIGG